MDSLIKRVCLAPLLVAVGFALFLSPDLVFPDEREYFAIARNLIGQSFYSMDGVSPTAYRPPSYPIFLASLMLISSSVVWLKIVGLAMWAATVLLAQRVAEILYGKTAGIFSVLMSSVYLVDAYTATTLYPQIFVGLLLVAALFLSVKFEASTAAIPVMVLLGVASLAVPNFVFTIPIFFIALWKDRRSVVRLLIGICLVGALFAPWVIRNYEVFGRAIPLSTSGGINLLLGNSAGTTANAGVNVDLSLYDQATTGMSEIERNGFYTQSAIEWIIDNKAAAVRLFAEKFANWFNYQNELATNVSGQSLKALVVAAIYYPILLLAAFSVRFPFSNERLGRWVMPAIYLLLALSYAAFFTRIRFRVPFDEVLIVMASIGAAECWKFIGKTISSNRASVRP